MKKTLLLIAAFAFVMTSAFAQEDGGGNKPSQGAMGIGFSLSGGMFPSVGTNPNTGTVTFKYLVADNMAARVGLGYNSTNSTTTTPTTTSTTTSITKSSGFNLSLGMEYHLSGTNKIDPYVGGDLYFGSSSGSSDTKTITDVADTLTGAAIGDYSQTVSDAATIGTVGFNAVFGINYFIVKNISIGVEFGWGFQNQSTKNGDTVTSAKVAGVEQASLTTTNKATAKNGGLNTRGGGTIAVNIFF